MQKRSLSKIFIYTILTLGIYELIWLYQTRQELMEFTPVRITPVRWLVFLNVLQFAGFILAIGLSFMLITTDKAPIVTPSCWSEYVMATAPETTNQVILSDTCRNSVERSIAVMDRQDRLIKGYLIVVGLLLLSRMGYPRWLRSYALAVQQVTRGKLTQTRTMFLLVFSSVFGMMAVQDVFNGTDAVVMKTGSSVQAPYRTTENKTVHRILSVLAISLVAIFSLFVLAWIILSYYATH